MKNKLLIIGSDTIHTYNYIKLIEDYFDDILLLTNKKNEKYGIKSIVINFHLGLNIFTSVRKVQKIVKEYNPTIIHIHQANSYAFIPLLGLKNVNIPKVLTAWGSDILINPKKNIIFKKMLEYSMKNVNILTSDSLYMANEMKSYNLNSDIRIANFGIEEESVKEKKENIIYSNRLHKDLYNIDKVVLAFSKFVKKHDDWRLVVAGSGVETENLKTLVKDLGIETKVDFIGWVSSEINTQMYQKSKIYISIPSSDATSISLLEAISYNCICFVSNLPANGEHILDRINGFIVFNLEKINFEKYKLIDNTILKRVNGIRKESYLKSYNRKLFIEIYDELQARKL